MSDLKPNIIARAIEPLRYRLARWIARREIAAAQAEIGKLVCRVVAAEGLIDAQATLIVQYAVDRQQYLSFLAATRAMTADIEASLAEVSAAFQAATGTDLAGWIARLNSEPRTAFRPVVVAGRDIEAAARTVEDHDLG